MFSFCIKHVKKSIIIRLSAENKSGNYSNYYLNNNRNPLPPTRRDGGREYKLFPATQRIAGYNSSKDLNFSQRLESGDFIYPYLVGLIEGDG
jgi:hypothetical protein